MQLETLWNLVPIVNIHVYYSNIDNFLLNEDNYDDWAMFIVENGIFEYNMGGEAGKAEAGEIVICPPKTKIKRKTVSPISLHFLRFSWNNQGFSKSIPKGKIEISDTERLYSTLSILKNSVEFGGTSPEIINHFIYDIWMQYCYEVSLAYSEKLNTKDNGILQEAVDYIHAHVYEKMNIKAVANMVGLTAVQFERKFKREFLIAPKEYVTVLRLKKAKNMLINTKMTLAEIAQCSGYDNEYYFSNVFKKHFKIAPSKYRVNHKL